MGVVRERGWCLLKKTEKYWASPRVILAVLLIMAWRRSGEKSPDFGLKPGVRPVWSRAQWMRYSWAWEHPFATGCTN